ncbi:protein of unknown function [Paenibacillus alvei]|uniref:Uncharacterized protein n=1 Tax=Paenibacillus alvei TaxID=44250 RepID=A0A383R6A9_PAEAL|nr:protein of unknown function [Paenibacillus alvei]
MLLSFYGFTLLCGKSLLQELTTANNISVVVNQENDSLQEFMMRKGEWSW